MPMERCSRALYSKDEDQKECHRLIDQKHGKQHEDDAEQNTRSLQMIQIQCGAFGAVDETTSDAESRRLPP